MKVHSAREEVANVMVAARYVNPQIDVDLRGLLVCNQSNETSVASAIDQDNKTIILIPERINYRQFCTKTACCHAIKLHIGIIACC